MTDSAEKIKIMFVKAATKIQIYSTKSDFFKLPKSFSTMTLV